VRSLTVSDLQALEVSSPVPFELRLGADAWCCERILRVLPGRRVVLQARPLADEGEAADDQLLKLFLGSGHSRYRERERRGLKWLGEAGLPVPAVLVDLDDKALSGLVLEYLPGAAVIAPDDQETVQQAAALLGRMHQAGLWQVDLHLKNFVSSGSGLFAVDGDGVRRRANPLPLGRGLEDLALLAAQRPPQEDEGAESLLAVYLANRPGTARDIRGFSEKIDQARRGRVGRYLKKCFRSCTEFAVTEDQSYRYFARRGRGELVRELLSERNAFTSGDKFLEMEAVKTGNSATLVRTRADGGVIIKRYNVKSLGKALGRLMRPVPRYRRAWMAGQLMCFLDLPTAQPLALIEEKRLLLPPVAYLVMEDLPGRELGKEVAEKGLSQARAAEVARLFVLLKRAGLTHGDTKSSNFIVAGDKVHLVDLDAMRIGISRFDKDIERFLANWQGEVRERFVAAFQAAELL
jgi:tRNA A-37 threonylcarbamoyl transferase component Bud32